MVALAAVQLIYGGNIKILLTRRAVKNKEKEARISLLVAILTMYLYEKEC